MRSPFRRSLKEIAEKTELERAPDRLSTETLSAIAPPAPEPARSPAELRRVFLQHRLARRLLHLHLEDRRRSLESHPEDLGDLEPDQAAILIRAMAAAGHADGQLDDRERRRVLRAMATTRLAEAERHALAAELEEPQCLESLIRQVKTPEFAVLFYSVSLVAAQRGKATNKSYLTYVAQRLKLPADVVVRLNRRYDIPA